MMKNTEYIWWKECITKADMNALTCTVFGCSISVRPVRGAAMLLGLFSVSCSLLVATLDVTVSATCPVCFSGPALGMFLMERSGLKFCMQTIHQQMQVWGVEPYFDWSSPQGLPDNPVMQTYFDRSLCKLPVLLCLPLNLVYLWWLWSRLHTGWQVNSCCPCHSRNKHRAVILDKSHVIQKVTTVTQAQYT